MFIIFATDKLHQLVRRPNDPPPGVISGVAAVPTSVSPLNSVVMDAPKGTRYQLLRALRAMDKGEMMVVERRISQVAEHLDDESGREAWFQSLRNVATWQGVNRLEPVLVPGTAYPGVIGRIIIRSGWCTPSDKPHWVPNLRFFLLTESGREAFNRAQAWWLELTVLERMQAMLFE
ncbi:MAG: hypothetical protein K9J42_16045 [Sulfuritalea sp.]|nr:hypothetical protein [Sulfuritalea sp.]